MKSLFDHVQHHLPDHPCESGAAKPVRSTRKAAQWSAGIHQAYAYLTGRACDPQQQAEIDRLYEQTMQDGPDFMRVRRNATFGPVPVVAYDPKAAAAIMQQAREIERGTYAARAKGKHGGGLGRAAMQVLEWFAFVMWPKGRYGMFPSLEHIAAGARMHKDTAVNAIKTLELFGFLTVTHRRKRVETPFGVKQVQDTNAYVLNLAGGLGALAIAAIRTASESVKTAAKKIISFKNGVEQKFSQPEGEKFGFWGQIEAQWNSS